MNCFIQDAPVPSNALVRREMNFGQPIVGIASVPYRIELTVAEFVELIRTPYAQLVRELIEDEPNDDCSFNEINRVRDMGWPELDRILTEDSALLFDVVREWLASDIIDGALRTNVNEMAKPSYAINSLQRIFTNTDRVCMCGEALRYPEPEPTSAE
jgi:hypothetical protein